MYKRFRKSSSNYFLNTLFYQVMVCLFILSFVLIINSLNIKPAHQTIETIRYWLSYKYDFIKAYNELKSVIPVFKQKVINTFEQIGGSSKGLERLILPVNGTITSRFGVRINPITKKSEDHNGIDISAPAGSNVYAVLNGIVKSVKNDINYGTFVVLEHQNGYETLYAHLQIASVKNGECVNFGDIIGKVGTSGESTGPHLHFEVIKNGKAIDPIAFLDAGVLR